MACPGPCRSCVLGPKRLEDRNILNNGQPGGQEVVSAHECRELIKEADDDGDKRISFSEFLDMMKGTAKKAC